MRAASALAVVALALLAGACGGGDDGESPESQAEAVVRAQLVAIDENRAGDFCATLTSAYAKKFTGQIATVTRSELKDCPAAFAKARSLSDSPTFEGKPLAGTSIDEIDFKTTVDGSKATVTGPAGAARYELVKQGDEWKIDAARANAPTG